MTVPSGSGKTTLLHILAGILKPSYGDVTVAGYALGKVKTSQLLLAALGAALGLLLGHVMTSMLGAALRFQQIGITAWTWNGSEVWIVAGALVVGVFAALLPAWRAYETDIAGTLARG